MASEGVKRPVDAIAAPPVSGMNSGFPFRANDAVVEVKKSSLP